ncbi:MAG: hypothetical protein K0R84_974 [Clostridia bacterium]|nr:hypothetical protein [Clostridia bacterium]
MNFFIQVRESVIDFGFYKSIKNNRFAKSFLYLLLLFLIIYSFIAVRNFIWMRGLMDQAALNLSVSIPDFEFKDGKFSFEGEMPYYISSSTNELIVIDTTGATDSKVIDNVMLGILITEDTVYMRNNNQAQQFNLEDFKDVEFNKQDLIERLPSVSWLMLVVMIVAFVFVLGWKLITAVLLALIGVILNSVYKTDLKFNHLLNFSIYALTLPLIIDLAVDMSGFVVPYFFIIYWFIAILYLSMAMKAYREG